MHTLINPKLLHKSSSDDVLIADATVPLPDYIHATAAPGLEDQLQYLLALYRPHDDTRLRLGRLDGAARLGGIEHHAEKLSDGERWLALRAIPHQLAAAALAGAGLPTAGLTDDAAKFVAAMGAPRRSSSYIFLNEANHYFFYRKTHDHVPGIMLVEAQRQAIYHHLYSQSGWLLGEVTVSLNNLQANFYDYANLMYPIEIVVDDLAPVLTHRPRRIHYRVSFYQRGKLIAVIDSGATVIAIENFKQIRNTFMHAGEWFKPIDNLITCKVSRVTPPQDNNPSELRGKLSAISKAGIRFEAAAGKPALFGEMRVEIANGDGKTFAANAILESVRQRESTWRFDGTKSDDLLMLGLIIASGCVSTKMVNAH